MKTNLPNGTIPTDIDSPGYKCPRCGEAVDESQLADESDLCKDCDQSEQLDYDDFLKSKVKLAQKEGFDPVSPLNPMLFDWQKLVVAHESITGAPMECRLWSAKVQSSATE